ncbi:LytTR family DNA-binding domain-containing protein [Ruminococcus sp. OA3]|uniref:LytR/AlgR family response regulator transcription factor n=1 Tax=Ruminococcus sp. OA3 TaxID=2914164 RepID=UPI001F05B113|nr:LytTR family DNA-binding domain-containing protein [Ruminococcus sp. OA3]MCH1984084.1 LytTR family DNA-binding domain-containing protein [Ruminococcus sp. OA3]
MIQVMLCDDDPFILKLAGQQIEEEIAEKKLDAQIVCVAMESLEIFRYIQKNPGEYLVFLDLDFGAGRLNGMDVARKIRELSQASKIVFVTNHQEMAMQVLQSGVEPFGFLEKTTDMRNLKEGFGRYIRMASAVWGEAKKTEDKDLLVLTIGIGETVNVRKSSILYVEAEKAVSHGVTYHTMDGSAVTVRDTIERVLGMLGDDFLKVHRSVVASKRYMVGMQQGMLKLANGELIPCSVRMRNEVKRWLE